MFFFGVFVCLILSISRAAGINLTKPIQSGIDQRAHCQEQIVWQMLLHRSKKWKKNCKEIGREMVMTCSRRRTKTMRVPAAAAAHRRMPPGSSSLILLLPQLAAAGKEAAVASYELAASVDSEHDDDDDLLPVVVVVDLLAGEVGWLSIAL